MMKKKGKKKKVVVKKAVTKKRAPRQKKEKDAEEVRKDLVRLVKDEAHNMAVAVVGEGKKGGVPPFKYLLEMAGLFPKPPEVEEKEPNKDEESLAETLLDRLGIPKTPVVADEYDKDDEIVMLPAQREETEKDAECEEVPVG
ncbi:MAG TPA: hypothetical protein VJQ59_05760 [Candidatus Sulfotelmatobacter sp.]|nr:hypothetical protein [Candidatus Sulfotelmatobacter sp.]